MATYETAQQNTQEHIYDVSTMDIELSQRVVPNKVTPSKSCWKKILIIAICLNSVFSIGVLSYLVYTYENKTDVENIKQLVNTETSHSKCEVERIISGRLPKRDCMDWYIAGSTTSGVYGISLNRSLDIDVYCDMSTDGGGWLVFQRRTDGSENFDRGWTDYENGFGNKSNEFWLGNKYLHMLTKTPMVLRIDLEDWNSTEVYAKYSVFRIGDSESNYTLCVTGYSGNAGDGLKYHNDMMFSTKDHDNDMLRSVECAEAFKGGWWFKKCSHSFLNGKYIIGGKTKERNIGINWEKWHGDYYSLKQASMMRKK